MFTKINTRPDLKGAKLVEWDQGGRTIPTSITPSNARYTVTGAVTVSVSHFLFTSSGRKINTLLRADQIDGDWENGNFSDNEALLYTDRQSPADGPIILEFSTPVLGAGAQIQSATLGEFTGELRVVDADGYVEQFARLGNSTARRDGQAIFLGVIGDANTKISRLEFFTTNIVNSGHAVFDKDGFAINALSVAV